MSSIPAPSSQLLLQDHLMLLAFWSLYTTASEHFVTSFLGEVAFPHSVLDTSEYCIS